MAAEALDTEFTWIVRINGDWDGRPEQAIASALADAPEPVRPALRALAQWPAGVIAEQPERQLINAWAENHGQFADDEERPMLTETAWLR